MSACTQDTMGVSESAPIGKDILIVGASEDLKETPAYVMDVSKPKRTQVSTPICKMPFFASLSIVIIIVLNNPWLDLFYNLVNLHQQRVWLND